METLVRRRVLRRLIWVCAVCQCPTKRALGLYGLNLGNFGSFSGEETIAISLKCFQVLLYAEIYCFGSIVPLCIFHTLLELGKRDKMRGLPSILSLFRNKVFTILQMPDFRSMGRLFEPANRETEISKTSVVTEKNVDWDVTHKHTNWN